MAASKVGFVGLGVMGLSMARNIIRGGHSVTGYDISDEALDKFRQSDGRIAESPAEAASGSAATVVMVPNPEHVEDVVHGRSGILEGLPENGLVIVMSTVDPNSSITVAHQVQSAGFRMLEAPVTRSSQHAVDGELGILVGGKAEDLEEARELLLCMGSDVTHCGPIGTGAAMKLANNMLSMTNITVANEVLTLGLKAGLEIGTMLEVLRGTLANNGGLDPSIVDNTLQGDFSPGFMTRLAQKDLRLGVKWASESGSMTHICSVTHQLLAQATMRGYGSDHCTSTAKLYEEAAGVELRQ